VAGEVELEMQSAWGICSQSLVYLPGPTCLAATQPIQKKQVLETPGPIFQKRKVFVIEGYAP